MHRPTRGGYVPVPFGVRGEAQSTVQICAERRGLQPVSRKLLVVRVCLADTTSCEEVVSHLVPNLAVES